MCTVYKAHMLKYQNLIKNSGTLFPYRELWPMDSEHIPACWSKYHQETPYQGRLLGIHRSHTCVGQSELKYKNIHVFVLFPHSCLNSSAENVRLLMSIISVKDHYYFRLGHCTSTGDKIQRGAENWCCDWIGPQNGTSPSPPWTDRHI